MDPTLAGIIIGACSAITTAVVTGAYTYQLNRRLRDAEADRVDAQAGVEDSTALKIQAETNVLLIQSVTRRLHEVEDEMLHLRAETEQCHADRDADRVRIHALELEVARYKGGITATYESTIMITPEEET